MQLRKIAEQGGNPQKLAADLQPMNWDDLRYLLAVAQSGGLKGAARALNVDKTTVSRRLQALERALGETLVERVGSALHPTEFAAQLLRHVEAMQDAAQAIGGQARTGQAAQLGGVRITAVPLVINHVLIPALPMLLDGNPGLTADLISDPRDLSLLRGEADIALRLARPEEGGDGVLARRLGRVDYAAYSPRDGRDDLPWIGYDRRMQFLPQALALSQAKGTQPGYAAHFNDAESLLHAVLAGQGRTLLPRMIGDRDTRLVEVGFPEALPPARDLWLLVRRELRELERIKRAIVWIENVFSQLPS